ncbi:MAG: hypothetical protein ABEJ36_04460 [Candidatus Nanosalina sp.]
MRQAAAVSGEDSVFEELEEERAHAEGNLEFELGDHFDGNGDIELDEREKALELPEVAEEGFRVLDEVYDALKLHRGNNRFENLRYSSVFGMDSKPGATGMRWEEDYREAGLVDEDGELTSKGKVFLDITPEGNDFEGHETFDYGFDGITTSPDSEDEIHIAKVYNDLRTTSTASYGENNGGKIHAFMLYAAGFDTSEVQKQVSLRDSHVEQVREDLVEDGLLDSSYRVKDTDGRAMYDMMVDQLDALESIGYGN